MKWAISAATLAAILGGAGCSEDDKFFSQDRLEKGLVVILPGIEGESPLNRSIREGLATAGVNYGMTIYHWGRPIPIAGPLLNQMDFLGNRLAGESIAHMIVQYQDTHPGKPVYLVGHSGGGGVAVFAAEAMPEGRSVDGLVLLSASISSPYDLSKALQHSRGGLLNFYNPEDVGLLAIGTTIAGNVDGARGESAGLIGFKYRDGKLFQRQVTAAMGGDVDPHASTTRVGFVSTYVAPWILSPSWPAGERGH